GAKPPPGHRDLGDRQAGEGVRADPGAEFGGRVRVEVAVPAAGPAERHVNIDAERPAAHALRRTLGQCAVGGNRLTRRERARHVSAPAQSPGAAGARAPERPAPAAAPAARPAPPRPDRATSSHLLLRAPTTSRPP